jgi:hypothetical protein
MRPVMPATILDDILAQLQNIILKLSAFNQIRILLQFSN